MMKKILLENAFNLSQDRKNVLGIWWYHTETGELEYSTTAGGHLDAEHFSMATRANADVAVIRGRLISYNDTIYLVVFRRHAKYVISYRALIVLKEKIEKRFRSNIDAMVDDEGTDILEI